MLCPTTVFDLDGWLESHPEALSKKPFRPSSSPSLPPGPNPNKSNDSYSNARAWIAKALPAISGQGGHRQTFIVANSLIKGFCLSSYEALSLLQEWNSSCIPPWEIWELEHKISEAEKSIDQRPRGWLNSEKKSRFGLLADVVHGETDEPTESKPNSGILDDPASIAIKFMETHKVDSDLCEYRWWNGQFYKWNGSFYDPLMRDYMNSIVFWFIEDIFIKKYIEELSNTPAENASKVKKKKVNNTLIENVKTGIINIISINSTNQSEPFWLATPPGNWAADEVIPAANRLIHVPSFVLNKRHSYTKKHPRYFSTYSLKYDFNSDKYEGPVNPPPVWDEFLHSTWPDDEESILSIQEWMGYFLTPCTKFQKMLMFIGQKRSGKGTIIRTLKHMLGKENVCYPTFKSMTTQFGKQGLIGKTLAVFPDARITGRTDVGDVVECLLSITGEDSQDIDRKYLTPVTQKLLCRFLISSNELPRLTENSGALVSRAIILAFNESFIDREDIELEDKLAPEIPQILRWSIDGWKRLNDRGKFLQSKSGAEIVGDFLYLSSPMSHFLSDCTDINKEYSYDLVGLFNMFRNWCGYHNRDHIGDMDNFSRNLRSAVPALSFGENTAHNGDGNTWSRLVRGLRLKPELNNGHSKSAFDAMAANPAGEYAWFENKPE